MRKQTLISSLTTRFTLKELAPRRMPRFTKRPRGKYLSKNICTDVEEWTHGYFCLGYFSSSTHFDLVIRLAQKAWRQCVLVFVHDVGLRDGNCIGLLANTGLFLSTGNKNLFILQRRLIPFGSRPLLLTQFSHAWRQSFVIDFLIFSPLHHGFQLLIVGSRYLSIRISKISSDGTHNIDY